MIPVPGGGRLALPHSDRGVLLAALELPTGKPVPAVVPPPPGSPARRSTYLGCSQGGEESQACGALLRGIPSSANGMLSSTLIALAWSSVYCLLSRHGVICGLVGKGGRGSALECWNAKCIYLAANMCRMTGEERQCSRVMYPNPPHWTLTGSWGSLSRVPTQQGNPLPRLGPARSQYGGL